MLNRASQQQRGPKVYSRMGRGKVRPERPKGHNFRRLIRGLSLLLRQILAELFAQPLINPS